MLLLDSHFLTNQERVESVNKLLPGFSIDIVNFIKIIVKHNRVKYLNDILEAFNSLCNENQGVLEGLLYSAFSLDEKTINQIKNKIFIQKIKML